MNSIFVEMIGWTGSALILGAYALLSLRKISSDQITYHAINIIGAFLLATYSGLKDAYAMVFLNVIWSFIGFYALHAIYKHLKKSSA